jgi:DNA helicase-2/ATP-dependent DNA helicase PcrA
MQYKLIKYLASGNLCVIGDPNQAIYGFRGADISFFNDFKKDYPDAKIITLNRNYRSTNIIVQASSQIINTDSVSLKPCFNPDKIVIHTAPSEKAEAEFVVHSVEKIIGGHDFFSIDSGRSSGNRSDSSFSDFAILFRTYSQTEMLVEAFERSGIPFINYSQDLISDKPWVQDLILYLDNEKHSLAGQIKQFSQIYKNKKIQEHILFCLVNLAENSLNKEEFINKLLLLSETDTFDKNAERVSLLTLHSSKGLEFNNVFIVGLEDSIIPLYYGNRSENIEEEKRLFYVGITRAKERLFLSRTLKRKWQGAIKRLSISPFLLEIKETLLSQSRFESKENVKQLSLF